MGTTLSCCSCATPVSPEADEGDSLSVSYHHMKVAALRRSRGGSEAGSISSPRGHLQHKGRVVGGLPDASTSTQQQNASPRRSVPPPSEVDSFSGEVSFTPLGLPAYDEMRQSLNPLTAPPTQ